MLFGSKQGNYHVGVDFGTRSIKFIELRIEKNKPHLVNYGQVFLDNAKETMDHFKGDYSVLLREALGALLTSVSPQAEETNVAIPAFNGLVMMVDFPEMAEEELDTAIQYESRKYIPTSLKDVNISWEVVSRGVAGPDGPIMKVLLVVAQKNDVQYYSSLFDDANLVVDVLELETFALVRSIVGTTEGRFLLIDIGAKTTNIVLVENGIVYVNRNIDVGGIDITSTIVDNMNISSERARVMKESDKNLFTGPMAMTFPSLDYTITEIDRILKKLQSDAIDSVILSGGTSGMNGLLDYFAQQTKMDVQIGNPLSHIVVPDNFSPSVRADLETSFAIAIGLALGSVKKEDMG